jgi:hypothetical protein
VDNVFEFNQHVNYHSEYIKKYIISKIPDKFKAYNPSIVVNPLSDLSSSILHLHFMQNVVHFNPLKYINLKNELLSLKSSIYDIYSSNSNNLLKIQNLLKMKHDSIFDSSINNPYLSSLKISGLLSSSSQFI